jgi:hypothetical protein
MTQQYELSLLFLFFSLNGAFSQVESVRIGINFLFHLLLYS